MDLRQERENRGLIYQFSDEKLFDLYNKWGQSFYIWFDPSADSLQIGNMFSVMAAVHLMKYGNKCYFLVWWATGMIWDPSGRSEERNFISTLFLFLNFLIRESERNKISSKLQKIFEFFKYFL